MNSPPPGAGAAHRVLPFAAPGIRLLEAALHLAQHGFPVFPCREDKAPLVCRGMHSATTDEHTIRHWWSRRPNALIGMPTGERSGTVVLDLDVKNGRDGIAAFERLCGEQELPPHPVVRTRSGGEYHYFGVVPGRPVRNSAGRLGDRFDVRGEGGYVIVPPSPGYEIIAGGAALPPPPDWLQGLLEGPPARLGLPAVPVGAAARCPREVRRRLGLLLRKAATAARGSRNCVLFWCACRAGEMVAARLLTAGGAVALMACGGMRAGLSAHEARRTAGSGVSAGMAGGARGE
jgi:hypothetical protein